jgi:hypothetical protein
MKKKMKRFQDGGFTKEQEDFLGGADRTDPYILARMRSKFPDAPKSAKVDTKVDAGELRDETGEKSNIRRNTETGDLYSKEISVTPAAKSTPAAESKKPVTVKTKEVVVEKTKDEPKKEAKNTIPKDFGRVSLPKSFSASGGNTEPKKSTAKLSSVNLSLPDPLEKYKKQKGSDVASRDFGYKKGGMVSSASKRADGCAIKGKTRGRMM